VQAVASISPRVPLRRAVARETLRVGQRRRNRLLGRPAHRTARRPGGNTIPCIAGSRQQHEVVDGKGGFGVRLRSSRWIRARSHSQRRAARASRRCCRRRELRAIPLILQPPQAGSRARRSGCRSPTRSDVLRSLPSRGTCTVAPASRYSAAGDDEAVRRLNVVTSGDPLPIGLSDVPLLSGLPNTSPTSRVLRPTARSSSRAAASAPDNLRGVVGAAARRRNTGRRELAEREDRLGREPVPDHDRHRSCRQADGAGKAVDQG